jgi:hypothetical protein
MNLLTFAHRGEAQAFIHNLQATPAPELNSISAFQLYRYSDGLILITGEGHSKAMFASSFVLGRYSEIERVFNYGVAGLLTDKPVGRKKWGQLQLGEIYPIGQVYGHNGHQSTFHSFSSEEDGISVVTAETRVHDREYAQKLLPIASVVDRELWGIAYACHQAKKPFRSQKLLSDIVDGSHVCASVRDKAVDYSEKLFQQFQTQTTPSKKLNSTQREGIAEPPRAIQEQFHFSLTQQRLFEQLSIKLRHKLGEQWDRQIAWQEILEIKKRPKEKTRLLIQKMEQKLDPFDGQLAQTLARLTKQFEKCGHQVKFDDRLESSKIQLKLNIENIQQWKKMSQTLELLPYQKIVDTLEGDF